MPSSIQLEFIVVSGFKDYVVEVIDIEVPGQHVKALTCACQLVQQHKFSKAEFDRKKLLKKQKLSELPKDWEKMSDKEKTKEEARQKQLEEQY